MKPGRILMTLINFPFSELIIPDQQLLDKPSQVFSVIDLFDDWGIEESIDKTFAYMALAKHHTFTILTKRVDRMFTYLQSGGKQRIRRAAVDIGRELNLDYELYEPYETCEFEYPLLNVWVGVHITNQQSTKQIAYLEKVPAVVRFLNCEPLELIDLRAYLGICVGCQTCDFQGNHQIAHSKLHSVIISTQLGDNTLLCELDWIRSILSQAQTAKLQSLLSNLVRI